MVVLLGISLDRADHNTLGKELLHKRIDAEDWQGRQHRGGHLDSLDGRHTGRAQSKVESSATCVVRNTRRRSTMVMTSMSELLTVQHRIEVAVPVADRVEQADRGQHRRGQRQDDAHEGDQIVWSRQ